MNKILITPRSLTRYGLDRVPELQSLRERFELVSGPAGMTPSAEQLAMLVPGCVGWLAGVEAITAPVLEAATTLKIISRNGVGTDAIDLAAARRLGITVANARGSNAQSVAELALALALAALRNVPWSSAALVRGEWCRFEGRELADCTVGVVGLGSSELLKHPRVIATPHLGAFTTASVRNATQMAVKNLLAALEVL